MSQGGKHGRLGRDVHALAASPRRPVGERGERTHRRLHPHPHGGLGDAHPHRFSALLARQRHRPGQGHDLEVEGGEVAVGSFLAEGRDRHDDEAGIPPTQDVVLEPPAAQRPRREALEQEVGPLGEPKQEPAVLLAVEVQRDAPLAGIGGEPEEALGSAAVVSLPARRPAPRGIAPGRLDLDHVRPEVGEHLPGQEPQGARQVEHAVRGEEHRPHTLRLRAAATE